MDVISRIRNLWRRIRLWGKRLVPHPDTWQGMARALFYGGWLLLLGSLGAALLPAFSWEGVLGLLTILLLIVCGVLGTWMALGLLARARPLFRFGLVLALAGTLIMHLGMPTMGLAGMSAWIVGTLVVIGGTLGSVRRTGWRWHNGLFAVVGSCSTIGLLLFLALDGWQVEEKIVWEPMQAPALDLMDPGEPGPYRSTLYFYGPGTDPHRPEFGAGVDWTAAAVDGSALLEGWDGAVGWARNRYWNIESSRLPVRGRAYVPDGEGPFPIVLVVHGNHPMADYSDGGYDYLIKHFASHGYIGVSVDQNFLNSFLGDLLAGPDAGLKEENDARGWMLLQHLAQWRAWNGDINHPMSGKADLGRVVLIGHSRGGEAVSEAAVFNDLPAYPDDATVTFDFRFGLRGIIAIAPVDNQYHPRDRDTQPQDVSYLVIHGSHDGDVTAYAGYALFSRWKFTSCGDCFKAGLYLIGANHGQFNSSWGRNDSPGISGRLLNTQPIMDPQHQRSVATTATMAFLKAVLDGDDGYRRFLASPERAPHLFPQDTRMLAQFRHSTDLVVADYEEDPDVTTGSLPNLTIAAEGLGLWHESEVALKWRDTDTAAAALGWQRLEGEPAPWYRLELPDMQATAKTTLALSLAFTDKAPGEAEDYEPPEHIDFTLRLQDRHGTQAELKLTQRRALLPQVEPRLYKWNIFNEAPSEPVFQRYRFELAEWQAVAPQLDLTALSHLTLVFDQTEAGALYLDDLIISNAGY